MPRIAIIQPEDASDELQEIYAGLISQRGKIAEIHKALSLNPEAIVNHLNLYMTVMFGSSPLKRVQREMMAVVVSTANACEYCQAHHGEAVNYYWKAPAQLRQLIQDYTQLDLSEQDRLLCDLAQELTLRPGEGKIEAIIEGLKHTGLEDRAILDAVLVVSYFNFSNRIVMGLDIELEADPGGYKY
jgi:uncharacterized peroxidase-related enzyme